ncbi:MAG: nucleotide exchange factor GrpE [Cyclobacteriaceae bacterium]|nr:nucleotide exchange factor GrpE [Cyclobacteriaceae bacterium]
MENTLNTEPELTQHEETNQEVPPGQSPEPETAKAAAGQADPVKRLQDELAEAKEKYVRLYAEFENHRRRTAKEKQDLIFGANETLLKALLPVLDDFERAEKSFKDQNTKESEGFFLIQNKYKKILEQYGVKPMEITADTAFNADLHEAITQVPAQDESKKGKIVDVVEKGYLLNDKVIRFAKVVVGS